MTVSTPRRLVNNAVRRSLGNTALRLAPDNQAARDAINLFLGNWVPANSLASELVRWHLGRTALRTCPVDDVPRVTQDLSLWDQRC